MDSGSFTVARARSYYSLHELVNSWRVGLVTSIFVSTSSAMNAPDDSVEIASKYPLCDITNQEELNTLIWHKMLYARGDFTGMRIQRRGVLHWYHHLHESRS